MPYQVKQASSLWLPFLLVGLVQARTGAYGQQVDHSKLFSPTKMTEVKLKGLRVRLGQPVQVTAQLGFQMGLDGLLTSPLKYPNYDDWAFIHAVSTIARFPKGDLLVTYTMVPDTNGNPFNVSGLQFSRDGGMTWGPRYTIIPEHQSMIYVPQDDDSLMAIPSYLYQLTPGDEHNFRAAYTRLEHGGRRVVIEPDALRVIDWPWSAELFTGVAPRSEWLSGLFFDGNAIKIGKQLLATGYFYKKGESLGRTVLLSSEDNGRTWRYFSTVAEPDRSLAGHKGYEGPAEVSMVQLADGGLMAVFRVGSGREWKLRRAYSHDGGRMWSKAKPLPAFSVEPRLLRTQDGTILLSTGRPGIYLWFSTDPRGETWQDIDIAEHHNRWAPDSSFRIGPYHAATYSGLQNTSYTQMVEVAPNRLLLVYDRSPEQKPANLEDLTRVFVLPIEVVRE